VPCSWLFLTLDVTCPLADLLCLVCAFAFNETYGPELVRKYVEVHHTRSSTSLERETIDPAKDLQDPEEGQGFREGRRTLVFKCSNN
jgi:hypothetical protein